MLLALIGPVFAQAVKGEWGPDAGAFRRPLCVAAEVLIFAVAIGVQIMFLLNLSKTLALCRPRNRTMEPGMVWLNLVPFLNIVWIFITVIRISESLTKEYRSRGLHSDDPDFAKTMGILYGVCILLLPRR